MGLGDHQVLVVSGVGYHGEALLGVPRQIVAVERGHKVYEWSGGPHLQMQPIAVELRVVGWAATVKRIEIECRRTALDEFFDDHV